MPSKFVNIRHKEINPLEILQPYGALSDSALLSVPEILERFPVSRPTLKALIAKGKFPPRIQLNRHYFCQLGECRKWAWDPQSITKHRRKLKQPKRWLS